MNKIRKVVDNDTYLHREAQYRRRFWSSILAIFILMEGLVLHSFISSYNLSKNNIKEMGEVNLAYESAKIENYLQKSLDVTWIISDTVWHMLQVGCTNQEVHEYLSQETNLWLEQVDNNYTGIYGYINGEYIDGSNWIPPEGYDPCSRDWYLAAIKGAGAPVMVSPYVDAQTGKMMISASQLLPDGKSVVSMDLTLNEIQNTIKNVHIADGAGYSYIIDSSGLVVAHYDDSENGKNYLDDLEISTIISRIQKLDRGSFSAEINHKKCSVFTNSVRDRWNTVVVVEDSKLFHAIRVRFLVTLLIFTGIFLVIVLLCYISYRSMIKHARREVVIRQNLHQLNKDMILALSHTVDAKDRYTSGHSYRVAKYAMEIARRLGKSEEEQEIIYTAGLLHDLGKIRVPDELINKADKLTEDEFELITIHTVSGYQILKDIYKDKQVAYAAKYHHERFDGKGYPNGLSGKNIPEIARIICVADSYDAMASNRSYRKVLPQEVVRSQIVEGRGSQFDPLVADIMLQMIDEDSDYKMKQPEALQSNILVIDDEEMNIMMVSHILKDENSYTIFGAQNYEEAEKIMQENHIDLILLDFLMPKIDGLEAIKMIQEKYTTPVIFMTSDKSFETISKSMEAGAVDYITKPFMPLSLKEIVRTVLIQM
ncbi:MAG: response regulator [Treponema sp.]|nr:response regulator [Treponema sp.]